MGGFRFRRYISYPEGILAHEADDDLFPRHQGVLCRGLWFAGGKIPIWLLEDVDAAEQHAFVVGHGGVRRGGDGIGSPNARVIGNARDSDARPITSDAGRCQPRSPPRFQKLTASRRTEYSGAHCLRLTPHISHPTAMDLGLMA